MKRFLVPIVAVALGAPFAAAHDFWLVPVGAAIEARTGSRFPVSTNAGWGGQAASTHAVTTVTDAAGRARVAVTRAGLWYVRTIHMREAHDRPFQWESFWASLTLTVR